MATQIQLRRGTAAEWTAVGTTVVLLNGELGVEIDTGRFKLGNGISAWDSLPYSSGPEGPQGPQGPQGLQGPEGPQGLPGVDGADGSTIISGVVDPTTEGVDGDYYINTATNFFFGPKAAGVWPSGVSIVGPQGPQGDPGQGVAIGGQAGQVLAKVDGTDYNTEWITPPSGGEDSDWTISGTDMYSGVSGKVGIGTTTPNDKLHVHSGDIRITSKSDIGEGNFLTITDAADVVDLASLYTWNGHPYLDLFKSSAGSYISFTTEPTNHSYVSVPNRNFGVGTTNPSEKLEVVGKSKTTTLQVTGPAAPAIGQVLTATDIAGNMSWQTPAGGEDPTKVLKTGDIMTGSLSIKGDAANNFKVTNAAESNSAELGLTASGADGYLYFIGNTVSVALNSPYAVYDHVDTGRSFVFGNIQPEATSKLTIDGKTTTTTLKVTGPVAPTIGQVLKATDAAGNMSWQDASGGEDPTKVLKTGDTMSGQLVVASPTDYGIELRPTLPGVMTGVVIRYTDNPSLESAALFNWQNNGTLDLSGPANSSVHLTADGSGSWVTGNLGVGIASPNAKLHISSKLKIQGASDIGDGAYFNITNAAGTTDRVAFFVWDDESYLEMRGVDGSRIELACANGGVNLFNVPTVGFGNASPDATSRIDVNGKTKTTTLQVTGPSAPTVGQVLTATNVDGSMSWQDAGGGGGTPGGETGQVQYNNAGSFAGASGVEYTASGQLRLSASPFMGKRSRYIPLLAWTLTRDKAEGKDASFDVSAYAGNSYTSGLATDGEFVWVSCSGKVLKVDPRQNTVVGSVTVNATGQGYGIAYDGASIWVTNDASNSIYQIRPSDLTILNTITGFSQPRPMTFDGVSLWVGNYGDGNIYKVDISTGVKTAVAIGFATYDMCFDGEDLWLATNADNNLRKVNVNTNIVSASYPLGWFNSYGIGFDGKKLWICRGDTSLTPVSLTGIVGTPITGLSAASYRCLFDGESMWVSGGAKVNVATNVVTAPVVGASEQFGMTYDGSHMWHFSGQTVSLYKSLVRGF